MTQCLGKVTPRQLPVAKQIGHGSVQHQVVKFDKPLRAFRVG